MENLIITKTATKTTFKYRIHPTRFAELGYVNYSPGDWRVVALDSDNPDTNSVGPHYRSKLELLADLERYATSYGCK